MSGQIDAVIGEISRILNEAEQASIAAAMALARLHAAKAAMGALDFLFAYVEKAADAERPVTLVNVNRKTLELLASQARPSERA